MPVLSTSEPVGSVAYAALFASSAIGVVICEEKGEIVQTNDAFSRMMGISVETEAPVGAKIEEFVSVEQRIPFAAALGEIVANQSSRVLELPCVGKGGERTFAMAAAVGIRAPEKRALCLFLDCTAYRATRTQNQEPAGRMALIGKLAAGVAHEINNPLAYALGNLSFAIENLQGLAVSMPQLSGVLVALRDALEGAERVRRTVRDLKMFSRPSSDRQTAVDVESVLKSAMSLATTEIRHRARLTHDFDVLPIVKANESHLAQVFLNLLINAAHSIVEGDIANNEIHVTTRYWPPGRVMVEIRDTGRGIEPEVLGRIFDPFSATRATEEGAGLGLAVCHRLIAQYEGEVTAESELGKGSTFRVFFPASTEAVESRLVPPRGGSKRQRARVLVVDDEPRIGSAIMRILAPTHEVIAVYTAWDAIARLEKGEDYDVILCDVMMPQMSGRDLYRTLLRTAPELVERVVFMTGGPFSTRGASFLDSVPNPRLEKPFSPEALRALVEKELDRR
jgi:signal transduction histidine kinase